MQYSDVRVGVPENSSEQQFRKNCWRKWVSPGDLNGRGTQACQDQGDAVATELAADKGPKSGDIGVVVGQRVGGCYCSVTKPYPTLCGPVGCSRPASLTFAVSWSLVKFLSIELFMPSSLNFSAEGAVDEGTVGALVKGDLF